MTITAATVLIVAPSLSSESEDRINQFIVFSTPYVNRRIWGNKADYAHALFTAHMLASSPASGSAAGGQIKSETVGDLSREYAVSVSESDSSISNTPYGRQFLQLRKTLLITPMVIR